MGLFDKKKEDEEIAVPGRKDSGQEEQPSNVKQREVRKMAGYDSIKDVAREAPKNYIDDSPAVRRRLAAQGAATPQRQTRISKEDQEAEERRQKRMRALQTVGKRYCQMLADLPYEMWSRFADQDFLKLTPDESKELQEAYFELAEALEPDLTSPWILGFGIMVIHGKMILPRAKKLKELEAFAQAEQAKIAEDAAKASEPKLQ